ncbi:hypothetical protein C8R47DRAFT_1073668 [Mycena vitilis]|nr:hypothetical protein C8R47DRAFT_1073668 [Mycena vitilis]
MLPRQLDRPKNPFLTARLPLGRAYTAAQDSASARLSAHSAIGPDHGKTALGGLIADHDNINPNEPRYWAVSRRDGAGEIGTKRSVYWKIHAKNKSLCERVHRRNGNRGKAPWKQKQSAVLSRFCRRNTLPAAAATAPHLTTEIRDLGLDPENKGCRRDHSLLRIPEWAVKTGPGNPGLTRRAFPDQGAAEPANLDVWSLVVPFQYSERPASARPVGVQKDIQFRKRHLLGRFEAAAAPEDRGTDEPKFQGKKNG